MKNPNGNKKVLIVDDDLAIVDSLQILLEMEGYDVSIMTEVESINRIQRISPALILLDIWMSGQDGRDIAKTLKSKKGTKKIPIIMISATKDIRKFTQEAGADDFIEKPFEMEDLLNKVKKYLDG
jgi:DNA-binding response OmpR family regulator